MSPLSRKQVGPGHGFLRSGGRGGKLAHPLDRLLGASGSRQEGSSQILPMGCNQKPLGHIGSYLRGCGLRSKTGPRSSRSKQPQDSCLQAEAGGGGWERWGPGGCAGSLGKAGLVGTASRWAAEGLDRILSSPPSPTPPQRSFPLTPPQTHVPAASAVQSHPPGWSPRLALCRGGAVFIHHGTPVPRTSPCLQMLNKPGPIDGYKEQHGDNGKGPSPPARRGGGPTAGEVCHSEEE